VKETSKLLEKKKKIRMRGTHLNFELVLAFQLKENALLYAPFLHQVA
jgi:hypothetical protein